MLADATRVRIVLALEDADKFSVSALAEVIDKSPAAVSQQLAKLRLARIVATRQEGQKIFYRLENEHASRLVADAILQAEHSLGGSPRHHHAEHCCCFQRHAPTESPPSRSSGESECSSASPSPTPSSD
ncbi:MULTISPECIES: ArsR/SmtB family transcription factor [Bacteria]